MKKTTLFLVFFAIICILASSCQKIQNNRSDKQIQEYFVKNNIVNAKKTASGLYYTIETPSNGAELPVIESIVTLHYEGRLLNDSIFDSSYSRGFPSSFSPSSSGIIQGFSEGLLLFGRGAKATIYIPSTLAYGKQKKDSVKKGFASIPKNSVLIFKMDIIDF